MPTYVVKYPLSAVLEDDETFEDIDRAIYLQGYIDGRIAAEKEFAEKFGIVIPPKTPKK